MIDGLLVVDKPAGMTSHDVVGRCRRVFAQRRVGHAGTLDPDATGVLLVGLGRATRLLRFLAGLPKSYSGEVVLGVATSTLDAAGEVTAAWDMSAVDLGAVREAAAGLTGLIEQVPPMVSARKVGGRRLHELARAGVEVERQARPVRVERFDVDPVAPLEGSADAHGEHPVFAISVTCSTGTYVRTLAADLGAKLGGGAHLRRLRRTAVGPWTLAEAVPLDGVGADAVLPSSAAVASLAGVNVDDATAVAVGHGKVLDGTVLGVAGVGPWAVYGPDGALLAVYEDHGGGRVKPAVVVWGDDPDGR